MDRSAIFVDAGYLFAEGGHLVCGVRSRAQVDCDVKALTTDLAARVRDHSGLEPLRTYWYDGATDGVPTPEHEAIGRISYVKVRLGRLVMGEQKGVDALIYRDLMTLARERAIVRAYLLSGDEDLREGVLAAQDMGVQVVLLGIPPKRGSNQSAALIREADEHIVLNKAYWERFLRRRTPQPAAREDATPDEAYEIGRVFAQSWLAKAEASDLAGIRQERKRRRRIPVDVDAPLLFEAEKTLGSLRERQDLRHALRAGFWDGFDAGTRAARLTPSPELDGVDLADGAAATEDPDALVSG